MLELRSILDQLLSLELTPILLAVVLGGLIGLEREMHGRPAGLRTHILVCLASTILVFVTRRLPVPEGLGPDGRVVLDPTRLAAGIVTGIGFLGAASVIRSGEIIRGITTGACIWCVAAIGVVIGYEAYGLAIASTSIILVVLIVFDWIEGWLAPVIYRKMVVRGRAPKLGALSEDVRATLKASKLRVQEVSGRVDEAGDTFELVFHIRCRNSMQAPSTLEKVAAIAGVHSAEWRSTTG